MTKRRWRWLLWTGAAIGGLLVLIMAAWVVVAGPVTVYRVIRYGDTSIDDYRHTPSRRLRASPLPYRFRQHEGVHINPQVETSDGTSVPLDQLLFANETIAFLMIQDDTIVFEQYGQGHSESAISQCFSVSKSIHSALIGTAIDQGLIESVNQPITDFLPELAKYGFQAVQVRHLLTMMSGTDYVEDDNPFGEHVILNFTPELEREALKIRMETTPGRLFRYKSGDTALLALMLSRVLAPKTISEYAQETLWTPLGMEHDGLWGLDREEGLERSWCCLAASARDFAKVGRLYLRKGEWDGRRILPAEWVRQSTRVPAVPAANWSAGFERIGLSNYGYQWWIASPKEADYLGQGKDGQFLYINPSRDVVIVRLGRGLGTLPFSRWVALFQQLSRDVD
jgi:CubicO group peptidase (beta-lactamase class C family)